MIRTIIRYGISYYQKLNTLLSQRNSRLPLFAYQNPRQISPNSPERQKPFQYQFTDPQIFESIITKQFLQSKNQFMKPSQLDNSQTQQNQGYQHRYYNSYQQKQLYKVYARVQFHQPLLNYLTHFNRKQIPYQQYVKDIQNLHYRMIPIVMVWAMKQKQIRKYIPWWNKAEQQILPFIHLLTPIQLAQLMCATYGASPRRCSLELRRLIISMCREQLNKFTTQELMHILHAFRTYPADKIQSKAFKMLKERGLNITDSQQLANIIYTYGNCKMQTHLKKPKERKVNQKRRQGFNYIDPLLQRIDLEALSLMGYFRVCNALIKCQLKNYKNVLFFFEEKVLNNIDSLTPYQLSEVMFIMFRAQDGQGFGSQELFIMLRKKLIQMWQKFSQIEKARNYYALAIRYMVTDELKQMFTKFLRQNMLNLHYPQLHYSLFNMMFTLIYDIDIMNMLKENILKQEMCIPIPFYVVFKSMLFSLKFRRYPHVNVFQQSLYNASFFYDPTRQLNGLCLINQFKQILHTLIVTLKILIEIAYPVQNFLIIDFALIKNKSGIVLLNQRNFIPETTKANAKFKLRIILLRRLGWKIHILNLPEYRKKHPQKRLKELINVCKELTAQQTLKKEQQEQIQSRHVESLLQQYFQWIGQSNLQQYSKQNSKKLGIHQFVEQNSRKAPGRQLLMNSTKEEWFQNKQKIIDLAYKSQYQYQHQYMYKVKQKSGIKQNEEMVYTQLEDEESIQHVYQYSNLKNQKEREKYFWDKKDYYCTNIAKKYPWFSKQFAQYKYQLLHKILFKEDEQALEKFILFSPQLQVNKEAFQAGKKGMNIIDKQYFDNQ